MQKLKGYKETFYIQIKISAHNEFRARANVKRMKCKSMTTEKKCTQSVFIFISSKLHSLFQFDRFPQT